METCYLVITCFFGENMIFGEIVLSKHRPSGPMLSISRFVRPCVCLCVCSLFEVPFKRLFAPTSQSRMSNIFRDSESLGKSNGKKWSQILTFLLKNGVKLPRRKKFLRIFFHLFTPFKRILPPLPEVQRPNFLDILNPWRKVMARSGLEFEIFLS